jgi:hypothetical protein
MRERASAAWAEIHDRTRPPVGIGFVPEMIGLAIMPHIHCKREANDRLSDIARPCRIDCCRDLGGVFLSAKIIQLMPSPGHDSEHTDFPAIAFRTVVPDTATDRRAGPDGIDSKPRVLNNADRTSSNE